MQADFIQKLGIKAGCRGRCCGRGPLGGARPSSYFPAFWSLAWRRTAQVGGDIRDPHIAQMDRTAYQVPGHQLVHELFHLREREVLTSEHPPPPGALDDRPSPLRFLTL